MDAPPIAGIRRIYNRQTGIGFVVFPPQVLMSTHAVFMVDALFLKTPDNTPHRPLLFELVMN